MKKDKHILINIDETQYKQLTSIAEKHDRKLSNLCYIIIKDYLIKTSKEGA